MTPIPSSADPAPAAAPGSAPAVPAVDANPPVPDRGEAPPVPAAGAMPGLPPRYRVIFFLLRLFFDGYLKTEVSGRENVPPPGVPTILTANHTSALDLFALGHALGRPAAFAAKIELTRIPVFGPFLLSVGAIPTRRDERDTDVLRRLLAELNAGRLIGLAPEGTRSLDGRLHAYDPGVVWLAARTGAVIVPCAIHGAYPLMPKGARIPHRGRIWVRFGAPMRWDDGQRRLRRDELEARAETVRRRTLDLLAALVRESGVANPALDEPGSGDQALYEAGSGKPALADPDAAGPPGDEGARPC